MNHLKPSILDNSSKILLHQDKLTSWVKGEPIVPITLEIHPSEVCNHHCPDCEGGLVFGKAVQTQKAKNGQFLDLKILDQILELPPRGISLSGNTGDPLMHPQYDQMIDKLVAAEIPVFLVTNGELLTPDRYRILQIARSVRFSLDAASRELHTLTHGTKGDSFDKILGNIKDFVSFRDNQGLNELDCTIGIGYLTDERTIPHIQDSVRLAIELGVDFFQLRPFHHSQEAIPKDVITECEVIIEQANSALKLLTSKQKYDRFEEVKPEKQPLISLRKKQSHSVKKFASKSVTSPFDFQTCHATHFTTLLNPTGELRICCHQHDVIADLNTQSWTELINNGIFRDYVSGYDISNCPSYCRHASFNSSLDVIKTTGQIPPTPELSDATKKHGNFF